MPRKRRQQDPGEVPLETSGKPTEPQTSSDSVDGTVKANTGNHSDASGSAKKTKKDRSGRMSSDWISSNIANLTMSEEKLERKGRASDQGQDRTSSLEYSRSRGQSSAFAMRDLTLEDYPRPSDSVNKSRKKQRRSKSRSQEDREASMASARDTDPSSDQAEMATTMEDVDLKSKDSNRRTEKHNKRPSSQEQRQHSPAIDTGGQRSRSSSSKRSRKRKGQSGHHSGRQAEQSRGDGKQDSARRTRSESLGVQDRRMDSKGRGSHLSRKDEIRTCYSNREVESSSNTDSVQPSIDSSTTSETDGNLTSKRPVAIATPTGALLFLSHPSFYVIRGKVRMKAVYGAVEINGYTVEPGREPCDIYSAEFQSYFTMKTVSNKGSAKNMKSALSAVLPDWNSALEGEDLKSFSVILELEKLESTVIKYITSISLYGRIFCHGSSSEKEQGLSKVLSPLGVGIFSGNLPSLRTTKPFTDMVERWTSSLGTTSKVPPAVMVCGAKNSGKSTTCRTLINHTLNRVDCVYYLECDIGQTEFTPPGCVSLNKVTQPVFGPPFCHQRKPVCCYWVGGLSPSDDPDVYMKCVSKCYEKYSKMDVKPPLIINTMGWVTGLGLRLLLDIIRQVQPSLIVQLQARKHVLNCSPLTHDLVTMETSWSDLKQLKAEIRKAEGSSNWREGTSARAERSSNWREDANARAERSSNWREDANARAERSSNWREDAGARPDGSSNWREDPAVRTDRHHDLVVMETLADMSREKLLQFQAADHRNLSLLSHLAAGLEPGVTLTSAVPYKVAWSCVAVHVCHVSVPREQIMYALNASVVALCEADLESDEVERVGRDWPLFFRTSPVCKCLGFGIVRGIDPEKKEFYVVTSLPPRKLQHVNALLKGAVSIPDTIMLKQSSCLSLAYVDNAVTSHGASSVKPRRYMPRRQNKKKPE